MRKHQVKRLKSEACIFLHEPTGTLIAVHANDVLFATPRDSLEHVYQMFENEVQSRRGLTITKDKWTPYLGRLYRRTMKGFETKIPERIWGNAVNLVESGTQTKKKTVPTPFVTEVIYHPQPLSQEALHSYRILIGKLIRAGGERPDLLYSIQELRRHFDDAKQSDLEAARRLALYLLGTLNKVLQLEADGPFATPETLHRLELHAMSGAAGTSTPDCRWTSGGALWIEGFLLHSWSEIQPSIAESRQEAEFVAANLCAREGLFVTTILEEIAKR